MSIIFHMDANSAYLSWTAVQLLESGSNLDIRKIPAAIAGDPNNRHGIILTKSIPAKKFNVKTGESILEAKKKCPNLEIFPPDYPHYLNCSNAMFEILEEYSEVIERFSIDECWMDFTASQRKFGDPIEAATRIKERIKKELGFTINVGVSTNKLLAKMASELKKPDLLHTLWPGEIQEKMWPLPVSKLFFVGRATTKKLKSCGINTIGELAGANPSHIKTILKPAHGTLVQNYANGIDHSPVLPNGTIGRKGVGNSITIAYDVNCPEEANKVILALTERVGLRLRHLNAYAKVVAISICSSEFSYYGHQIKLLNPISATSDIYAIARKLFIDAWKGEKIRKLGVHVSELTTDNLHQYSLFESADTEKSTKMDTAIDQIRKKYGDRSIIRGTFANGTVDPLQGGVNDGDFLMMGGYSL